MYRETVHSAKYIQSELRRRSSPPARSEVQPLTANLGRALVRVGQRLQMGAPVATPIAGV